ncbi:MAG: DUF885 domain-containing protein [Bryobacterales bacterium]|nr:DUF885 domain-containing protein [Bryobacteraceae bacterium]MDW8355696.1 DUF885 domain-containing protein [Bryobacterales bacterium]
MLRTVVLLVCSVLAAGCGRKPPPPIWQFAEEFVYERLALSPVLATQVGYHEHRGVRLDELLDDYSAEGLDRQRRFYRSFRDRLSRDYVVAELSPEDRADWEILNAEIALGLLELEEIRSYEHNPTLYVELAGNALFQPYVLHYAPVEERFRHIIARLEKIPTLMAQARQNLLDAPEIWRQVAIEENQGNIALIDRTLRSAVPEALRARYEHAAEKALTALREFNRYLEEALSLRVSDWRLGRPRYALKFRYALGTDRTPEEVLFEAEAELKRVRQQMFQLALPLHHKWYPGHRDPVDLNLIVGETLARIAQRRATPETYFAEARRDLEEARAFVRAKGLVPLPARDNLQVIETPEFMRGIYAVGGFAPAPPLEPHLGAYYWLTPIPKDWPRERIESKLREYNYYGLKLLTLHEAIPGHYVQLEHANAVEPKGRRVLRSVFGSGPYIEGWAVYSTEMMLDEGYLDGSPELRLTFLKQLLRVLANAILDIRLHTMGMTDAQAMELMTRQTFQETEEATAKLRRAKLSSCQLPTYYLGWRDWKRLREQYRAARGDAFRLAEFHARALKTGAVPIGALARILTGKPLAEEAPAGGSSTGS